MNRERYTQDGEGFRGNQVASGRVGFRNETICAACGWRRYFAQTEVDDMPFKQR